MDLVHVRPRGHERERVVEPTRHSKIRVLEQTVQRRPGAVDGKCLEAYAERAGERSHERVADESLERMLTDGGRDIDRRIAVVDLMNLPERWNFVHRDVRDVEREVERHDRNHT